MAVYWYSGELGVFTLRNSKYKERHAIQEHVIVLGLEDLSGNFLVRR